MAMLDGHAGTGICLENVLARNYQRDKLDSLSPLLMAFFCYFKIWILESLSVFFMCMNIGIFRDGLRAGVEAGLYTENVAGYILPMKLQLVFVQKESYTSLTDTEVDGNIQESFVIRSKIDIKHHSGLILRIIKAFIETRKSLEKFIAFNAYIKFYKEFLEVGKSTSTYLSLAYGAMVSAPAA
ncbi:hypothetical protein PV326_004743 [Microctonus aethiopoides]|nr:hypothetical protein PV326_004743 [Microctonus aethiopoides]